MSSSDILQHLRQLPPLSSNDSPLMTEPQWWHTPFSVHCFTQPPKQKQESDHPAQPSPLGDNQGLSALRHDMGMGNIVTMWSWVSSGMGPGLGWPYPSNTTPIFIGLCVLYGYYTHSLLHVLILQNPQLSWLLKCTSCDLHFCLCIS